MSNVPILTERFERAFTLANQLHAPQTRKGGSVPYIGHLMAVTSIVIENGGDEDTAIAALLHDGVEDQGGLPTLTLIREQFGDRVARIVMECSDNEGEPKPPWKVRKQTFIDSIPRLSPEARLVAIADKIHNVRSTIDELRKIGESVWLRFHGRRDGTLWYYKEVLVAFQKNGNEWLLQELSRVINEMFSLAGEPTP